jgi:hypothetical protein
LRQAEAPLSLEQGAAQMQFMVQQQLLANARGTMVAPHTQPMPFAQALGAMHHQVQAVHNEQPLLTEQPMHDLHQEQHSGVQPQPPQQLSPACDSQSPVVPPEETAQPSGAGSPTRT